MTETNGLTIAAPEGAVFEYEEVKTDSGTKSLGNVPILRWVDGKAALEYYGAEGVANMLDGTSARVSFQGIARRGKIAGKTDDDIAKAQIDFRPGKRAVGASTPVSRATSAAKKAAQQLGGDSGDLIAALLAKVARGELSQDDLRALSS